MAKFYLDREHYFKEAQFNELMEAHNLTNAEIAKTTQVSLDILKMLKHRDVRDDSRSNFANMCNDSLEHFEIFNNPDVSAELSICSQVPFYYDRDSKYYDFYIHSNLSYSMTGAHKVANSIIIPLDIRKSSAFYLSHELCHVLKERNSLECQDRNAYEEVIPILMEFIMAYVYDYESFEVIVANRCRYLKVIAREFIELYKAYMSSFNIEDKEIYMSAINEKGRYLHSFYYALTLFELYMSEYKWFNGTSMTNQEYILSKVANVLLCNESTKDMLHEVMDYLPNIDAIYERGIDRINDVAFGI